MFGSIYSSVKHGHDRSSLWVLLFVLVGMSSYLVKTLGPEVLDAPTWTILPAAFLPFAALFILFRLLDRWEPEPWLNIIVAFLWGGGLSIVIAGTVNTAFYTAVMNADGLNEQMARAYVAMRVAPVAEESLKGLFIVWLFLKNRTDMHSLMDGVFYTGVVASSFAFVENITYFLKPFGEYATYLTTHAQLELYGEIVFMRGVMSPFMHPMATTMLGLIVAYAYLYTTRRLTRFILSVTGWGVAVFIHYVWNAAAALLSDAQWSSFYYFVALPAWIVWMLLLWRLSLRERRIIAEGLEPYLRTNMISSSEVAMVCDKTYRNEALAWAKSYGEAATNALKRMIHLMSQMSMHTHLYHSRGYDNQRAMDVHASLDEIAQLRANLEAMQHIRVDPLVSSHPHRNYHAQNTDTTHAHSGTHSPHTAYDPYRFRGNGSTPQA